MTTLTRELAEARKRIRFLEKAVKIKKIGREKRFGNGGSLDEKLERLYSDSRHSPTVGRASCQHRGSQDLEDSDGEVWGEIDDGSKVDAIQKNEQIDGQGDGLVK